MCVVSGVQVGCAVLSGSRSGTKGVTLNGVALKVD